MGWMGKFLLLDIGAGTMDVLYYDLDSGLHYKAVVRSPVLTVAEEAGKLPGDLLVLGREMGGGPLSRLLAERACEAKVAMTRSSALTIHHDLERVRALGITLLGESEAEAAAKSGKYGVVRSGDLEAERIEGIVRGFGVPFAFDAVGVCAQDHGTPPAGTSHLDYRNRIFKDHLDRRPFPHTLLFRSDEVPETFNRLRSIAGEAEKLPTGEVYVMDSGMAAILGASMDYRADPRSPIMVLDVATSHTVGAAMNGGELAGFFECHTHGLTLPRLESLLEELAGGRLDHGRVVEEGGHGAYLRKTIGLEAVGAIVATGPKRRLAANSRLPMTLGAPLGDNMMTGTVGLLEAIRRRKALAPIVYL
jgi:uncharacterized protein (DUF1786 family)